MPRTHSMQVRAASSLFIDCPAGVGISTAGLWPKLGPRLFSKSKELRPECPCRSRAPFAPPLPSFFRRSGGTQKKVQILDSPIAGNANERKDNTAPA